MERPYKKPYKKHFKTILMKKFTLFAGMAAVALGASAVDFNVENGDMKSFSEKHGKGTYYAIQMSELSQENLTKAGSTVVWCGQNSADQTGTQNLYIWNGFVGFEGAKLPAPGWDNEEGMDLDYASFSIPANAGWTGAGYNLNKSGLKIEMNDETIFHVTYATMAAAPASVGLILNNQDGAGNNYNIALGADYNDNGTVYPSVGKTLSDEWQCVEVKLGDLKKMGVKVSFPTGDNYSGNLLAFLAGATEGQNFSYTNMFFFTPEGAGAIEGVDADDVNAPVEYFNLQGVRVANPENGLFIRRQGNKAEKVVL